MIIYNILQDPASNMIMTNNRKYFDEYRENNAENLKESISIIKSLHLHKQIL